jgi:hypothetical protein
MSRNILRHGLNPSVALEAMLPNFTGLTLPIVFNAKALQGSLQSISGSLISKLIVF